MPTAGLSLGTTAGTWSFQLTDTFLRQEDPPYLRCVGGAAAPIPSAETTTSPRSRRSGRRAGPDPGTLRYTNAIDTSRRAAAIATPTRSPTRSCSTSWKWLPKTAIFVQANQGYVSYLSANTQGKGVVLSPARLSRACAASSRRRSRPSRRSATSTRFYKSGATTSGILGSTYVDLQAIVTPSMLNRFTAGITRTFELGHQQLLLYVLGLRLVRPTARRRWSLDLSAR